MTVEEIRKWKKKYGFSNARLSEESGVPLGTVNKVLSGATGSPRYDTLKALAAPLLRLEARDENEMKLCETGNTEDQYRRAPSYSILKEDAAAYGIPSEKGPGDFTIEDYYNLPDEHRVELIDGVFYDMAAPSTVHQDIVLEIVFEIKDYIRKQGGSCRPFIAPVDVKIDPSDNKTMVQPDVIVVCDPAKIGYRNINGAPDFVLEVISPSTGGKDYYRKASKYEQSGVREYWIIDPIRKRLTVFYFETEEPLQILPLEGRKGIGIFGDELEIDLDSIASFIE